MTTHEVIDWNSLFECVNIFIDAVSKTLHTWTLCPKALAGTGVYPSPLVVKTCK